MDDEAVSALVAQRDLARKAKDYAAADEIKAQLSQIRLGPYRVELLDEPEGTFWYWTARK